MDLHGNIDNVRKQANALRSMNDQDEIKSSINEAIFLLRKIQQEYSESSKSVDWLEIERISIFYNEKKNRNRNLRQSEIDQLALSIDRFTNKLDRFILPIGTRYWHFFGSVAFVVMIPVAKVAFSYINKLSELSIEESKIIFSNFDLALPLVMYSWIASYATKSGIRRTWVLFFTFLSTSVLLKSNDDGIFIIFIILLTILTAVIQIYDAWSRHLRMYEHFSYYK